MLGPISKRNLVRGPLIVCAVSSILASVGVLLLTASTPIIYILIITIIFGVTMGTTASSNQIALYTQVSADQIATAAGLFRTFGYIGSIASSAIIGVVFRTKVVDSGLHVIAVIMIVVSILALFITIFDRKLERIAGSANTTS